MRDEEERDECPACEGRGWVEVDEVDGGGAQISTRVDCGLCEVDLEPVEYDEHDYVDSLMVDAEVEWEARS